MSDFHAHRQNLPNGTTRRDCEESEEERLERQFEEEEERGERQRQADIDKEMGL